MNANPNEWIVVKFVIAATGLKRREAREFIRTIPPSLQPQLLMLARAWDMERQYKASSGLSQLMEGVDVQDVLRTALKPTGGKERAPASATKVRKKRRGRPPARHDSDDRLAHIAMPQRRRLDGHDGH